MGMEKEDMPGRPYSIFNDMRQTGCLGNGEFQTIRGFIVKRQMGLSENVLGLPNHLL